MTKVCSQVREETRGVWYSVNKFQATILDCNADELMRWADRATSAKPANLHVTITPTLSQGRFELPRHFERQMAVRDVWRNLDHWCLRIIENPMAPTLIHAPLTDDFLGVIAKAHAAAVRYRNRKSLSRSVYWLFVALSKLEREENSIYTELWDRRTQCPRRKTTPYAAEVGLIADMELLPDALVSI